MNKLILLSLVLVLAALSGCEKDPGYAALMPGFWAQESMLEDGASVELSECEKSTRLLIEQNGVYRLFSSCAAQQRSGTWIITNTDMLDMSIDRWNGSNKYEPYPVRFTVTRLNGSEMEIRIKTFVGDRKKLVMFTPVAQDVTTGLTPEQLLGLDRDNKTLKTYIYRFVKHE
jgi:hypothetical protein